MSSMEGLVRLRRWTLDEKRRTLVGLERLEARLRGDLERLEREIEAEKASAGDALESGRVFPLYAAAALKRRDRLLQSLQKIENESDQARVAIQEAFEELKKVEQTRANLEQRRRARQNRREQAQLDEVALQLHRSGNGQGS